MAVTLQSELAIRALDETGPAFDAVTSKFRKLAQATRALGAAPVGALRQAAMVADRTDHIAGRLAKTVAATYAATKVAQLGEDVISTYATWDDRKRYLQAVLGISDEQLKPLLDQAMHLGGTTQYDALQVVEAQLTLAQRGVQANVIGPIVEASTQFAQAMNVDLPEAATTIEGILFSTGKSITDANEALAITKKVVDEEVKAAKISGLGAEDLKEGVKYAGLAGSTAGLSDASILAALAVMHRANIPGSEGGTAIRQLSARLVAPTHEGLSALAAMGVDWNAYATAGGGIKPDNLHSFMMQRFGRAPNAARMQQVAGIMSDPQILGDRAEFIKQMYHALAPGFGSGPGGRLRPQDSEKLTKAIGDFYTQSVSRVDSERLLHDLIAHHPTLAQLDALVGPKQAARIMALMRDDKFEEFQKEIANVPEGFAQNIAEQRMGGFSGARKRAAGSWVNVQKALGEDYDPELTYFFNSIATVEQGFAELSGPVQTAVASVTGLGTAFIGVGAILKGFELGLSGSAVALSRFVPVVGMLALLEPTARLAADVGKWVEDRYGYLGGNAVSTVPGVGYVPGADDRLPGLGVAPPAPAEVKGNAELKVIVRVDPNEYFATHVDTLIDNKINAFRDGGGAPDTGTAGSVGLSMPAASHAPR